LHPFRRLSNMSERLLVFRQVKGFPFQTRIWEDSCNRPNDLVILFGLYP
jgi:hypothetical protein